MAINSPETGNHGCEQSLTRLWKKCTSATRKTQVCQIKNTSCSFLTWKFAFLHLLEETTFKSIRFATMSIALHSSMRWSFLTNEMWRTYHNYHTRRKYFIFGVSKACTEHWATHSSLMQRKVSTLIINSPCLETELTRFPHRSLFTFFTFLNSLFLCSLFILFTRLDSLKRRFLFSSWSKGGNWRQLRPNEIAVAINNKSPKLPLSLKINQNSIVLPWRRNG